MPRILMLFAFFFSQLAATAKDVYLFIGTYTGSGSKGIYVYRFNTVTGKANWVSNTDSLVNPSFLTVSTNGKFVYSVTESGGNFPGKISAFSFSRSSGKLQFLNSQTSGGDNPCYVSVTKNGKWVAVGNYTGGNLSVFKTGEDGSLLASTQFIQHEGKSVNAERQEKAHVHSVVFSPDEKFLFVPDLGLDRVMTYKFNPASTSPLTAAETPFTSSRPGSGPRHLVFDNTGKYAYLIQEMSGTVETFRYSNGTLKSIQLVKTHPEDFKGGIGSADIHLSPDGQFLYASNRGDENTVTIFRVSKTSGLLGLIGYQPVMGLKPRNFCIDPSGNFLLVANQDSGNIVIFKRNLVTGLLSPTGDEIKIQRPVCLKMLE